MAWAVFTPRGFFGIFIVTTGILELFNGPNGRLRQLDKTFVASPSDPVVPAHLVEKFGLRNGILLDVELGRQHQQGGGGPQHYQNNNNGKSRSSRNRKRKKKNKGIAPDARYVEKIFEVDGKDPTLFSKQRKFEDLTSIDPQPRLKLEYPGCPESCRLIDLFCPIGYGTRGMIVSPPKAGKTTLLQNIAFAIKENHPEIEVIALLIDERPEEVTDFRRNVPCEVLASSNDHTPDRHVYLAMLAIEKAKRMVEAGKDVVVLLDSLTRVGRAFNTAPGLQSTGRTLSGGVDAGALSIPKQLFGAARNLEEGGSLTIVATCLVDTGSRGDQVIFEEFKGTGNMELILDRKIAERRLFPAIDLAASGTRKEEKLLGKHEYEVVNALRRRLLNMQPHMQIEQLLKAMERFENNEQLIGSPQSPATA